MNQESIFFPFLGMMLLTMLVWVYMYYRRLSYIVGKGVDPQSLATTRELEHVIPAAINTPSENLVNLFELPVLFYAVCLYIYLVRQVDTTYLVLAYGFLIARICHSVVHCTYNKVMHRFGAYVVSSILLWLFLIRAFVAALG